jgi:hypothetical protein
MADSHPYFQSTDEKVDYIVGLMTSGRFITGQTFKELSIAWGVSESTAKGYTSQASQIIRTACNFDDIRSMVIASLQTVAQRCQTKEDTKNEIRALEAIGRVIGPVRSEQNNGRPNLPTVQIMVNLPPEAPIPTFIVNQPVEQLPAHDSDSSAETLVTEPGSTDRVS